MNILERAIAGVSPRWAANRARSRLVLSHYDAASVGRRTSSLRADRSDADAAGRSRSRISYFSRDMVRNTPYAARAQAVISGGVVGDGILPKISFRNIPGQRELSKKVQARILERGLDLIETYLDTVKIDRQGRCNLYGLQRLAMNTVADSGEALIRIYSGEAANSSFQLQLDVLEPDYLDHTKFGAVEGGGYIREGIEYNNEGQRVAYWLYPEHPGADWGPVLKRGVSERVVASNIIHLYRVDRPGQQRGVSWFAPVMMRMQDLADNEDAQLMRQKIASCFAAFRVSGSEGDKDLPSTISPGMVYDLGEGEDVRFASPPPADGGEDFNRSILRSIASGLGITYEALSNDLSQVNFSSARVGRTEMDSNISIWQWLMFVPQFLAPFGEHFLRAWAACDEPDLISKGLTRDVFSSLRITWVPPRKFLVDPAREFSALREAVRSGFMSRQQVVRQLGVDPERLRDEQIQDREEADRSGLLFDSDPRADPARQSPLPEARTDVSIEEAAAMLGIGASDLRGLIADMKSIKRGKRQ